MANLEKEGNPDKRIFGSMLLMQNTNENLSDEFVADCISPDLWAC